MSSNSGSSLGDLASLHGAGTFFALSSDLGSEPTNGWRWMLQLSRRYRRFTVVVPSSVADRVRTTERLPGNVDLAPTTDASPPVRRGRIAPAYYEHYSAWLAAAGEVMRDLQPDVGHQLVMATPYWGSTLARTTGVRVLGPVGASPMPPLWAATSVGYGSAVSELARGFAARLQVPSIRPFQAIDGADVTLCVDRGTARLASDRGKPWVPFLADGCDPVPFESIVSVDGRADLLWVGRLMPRKGGVLAAAAFIRALPHLPPESRLVMVGEGAERESIERAIAEVGAEDRISLLGRLPNSEVLRLMATARGLVFSSLRDTFGGVCLEAAAAGTPVITVEHAGVRGLHNWIPRQSMWTQRAASQAQFVAALSQGMVRALTCAPAEWSTRSALIWDFAANNSWEERGDRMAAIVLRAHGHWPR